MNFVSEMSVAEAWLPDWMQAERELEMCPVAEDSDLIHVEAQPKGLKFRSQKDLVQQVWSETVVEAPVKLTKRMLLGQKSSEDIDRAPEVASAGQALIADSKGDPAARLVTKRMHLGSAKMSSEEAIANSVTELTASLVHDAAEDALSPPDEAVQIAQESAMPESERVETIVKGFLSPSRKLQTSSHTSAQLSSEGVMSSLWRHSTLVFFIVVLSVAVGLDWVSKNSQRNDKVHSLDNESKDDLSFVRLAAAASVRSRRSQWDASPASQV